MPELEVVLSRWLILFPLFPLAGSRVLQWKTRVGLENWAKQEQG